MWKLLCAVLKVGFSILWNVFFYFTRYARHPEKYPMEVRYKRVRRLLVKVVDALRVDQKVEGLENLKKLEEKGQKFLVVSNHLSAIDPLLLIYHSEKPLTFVAKKELEKYMFVRVTLKAIDGMFLDRNDLRNGVKIIRNVERLIKDNVASVAIFPEGTRNRHPEGDLPEFHGGTFKPAFRIGCPVLPVASFGSQHIIGKNNFKRTPYEITYFPVCYAGENSEENSIRFAAEMHDLIAKKMYEDREEETAYFAAHYEKIPLRKGPVR